MRFHMWLDTALGVLSIAFAAPSTTPPQTKSLAGSPEYYLRVNAPDTPWHNRHLVRLPSSHLLGLENFTIHPETPPVTFFPIELSSHCFALQIPYSGDNPSQSPYIAALVNTTTGVSSLGVIFVPDPTKKILVANPQTCPGGKECVVDEWTVRRGEGGGLGRFSFAGYPGGFTAVKDASPEGWHVYWRGESAALHVGPEEIELDVIPIEELHQEEGDERVHGN